MKNQDKKRLKKSVSQASIESDTINPSAIERFGFFWQSFNKRKLFLIAVIVFLILMAYPFYLGGQQLLKPETPIENKSIFAPLSIVEEPLILTRTSDTGLALVHIKNTNKQAGVPKLLFSWQAFDAAGAKINSGSGETYILPEQDKYIILPFIGVIPDRVKVNLEPNPTFKMLSKSASADLRAVNLIKALTSDGTNISGQVTNNSAIYLENADVLVLIRNITGNILGAVSTQVGSLSAQSGVDFSVLWPNRISEDVTLDVRVEANTF